MRPSRAPFPCARRAWSRRRSVRAPCVRRRADLDAGVLDRFDTPEFAQLLSVVDPSSPVYAERLKQIPKLAVVSSDDEFMQLDWTQHGWLDLPGETKLLVVPNSEHSLISGVPE